MFDLIGRLKRSATIALLISPGGILVIAATRLLIISDYNTATAAAIVTSSGYINTLLGTVLPLVQIFMPYVALVLLFFRRFIPGMLAFLAAALISPTAFSRSGDWSLARHDLHAISQWVNHDRWIYLVLAVAAIGLVLEFAGFGLSAFMRAVGVVASLVLILYVVRVYPFPPTDSYYSSLIKQPWLPAETITLTSGQQVIGYNLSSGGSWIEILKESGRTIEFYPDSSVAEQQICQLETSRAAVPLITFAPTVAQVPQCVQPPPSAPAKQASPHAKAVHR